MKNEIYRRRFQLSDHNTSITEHLTVDNMKLYKDVDNLAVLRINSALDKSRLRYIGPQVWLKIPPLIKEALSLKVFVKMYRNHLLGHFDGNIMTY